MLLVVDDAVNVDPDDVYKRSLFESWGYKVALIDDDGDQAAFDAVLGNNDVAYISETVVDGTLGDKLAATTKGVVNEEGGQSDNLAIASASANSVGRNLSIHDNSHYITELLSLGALPIYSADMDGLSVSGTLAPGLQTLADWGGQGGLAFLDVGAEVYHGGNYSGDGTATGRRVSLPIGRDGTSNFNWRYLNNNGRLIVQRAIQWGADGIGACTDGNLRDEFTAEVLSGNDGSLTWSGDWSEVDSAGIGAKKGKLLITAGELRLQGTPSTSVDPETGATIHDPSLTREADLSAYQSATLDFDFRTGAGVDAAEDSAVVEVSGDGGASWTVLEDFINAGPGASGSRSYNITPYIAADTQVRFRINTAYGGLDEFFYVDNVDITASCDPPSIPAKKVYWTDDVANLIQRSDEDGSNVETVLSGLNQPKGLDIDTVNGKIYWTDGTTIKRADLDGSNIEIIYFSPGTAFDIKLDVTGGKMYWTDESYGWTLRANLDGSAGEIIDNTLNRSAYITLDAAAGHLYLTEFGDGDVSRMNLDGSGVTRLISGPVGPIGNGLDLVNGQIYWTGGVTNDWIKRANLDGSNEETLVTGLNGPQDIVYDADNDRIYLVDLLNVLVQRANADGSNVETIVSARFTRPRGILLVNADLVPATESGGSAPNPGSCNGSFRDEFNTRDFAGSDGDLPWTGDWREVGEVDGPARGDIVVDTDQSDYQLRIRDNDNGGEGVERVADLSGATTALLSFDYRRVDLDENINDYVAVYLSSNGTAGPWTELDRIGTSNDESYQSYSKDISEYISANTAIRLRSSPDLGRVDNVWFDNVQIQCGTE